MEEHREVDGIMNDMYISSLVGWKFEWRLLPLTVVPLTVTGTLQKHIIRTIVRVPLLPLFVSFFLFPCFTFFLSFFLFIFSLFPLIPVGSLKRGFQSTSLLKEPQRRFSPTDHFIYYFFMTLEIPHRGFHPYSWSHVPHGGFHLGHFIFPFLFSSFFYFFLFFYFILLLIRGWMKWELWDPKLHSSPF